MSEPADITLTLTEVEFAAIRGVLVRCEGSHGTILAIALDNARPAMFGSVPSLGDIYPEGVPHDA